MLMPLDIAGPYMMPGGPMMGHYGHPHYFGGGFLVFLLPLLFLVALVLLRRAQRNGTPLFGQRWGSGSAGPHGAHHPGHPGPAGGWGDPQDEALRTLSNRLAAGDIDPEDYRMRVDTLRAARDRASDPTTGKPYAGPEGPPKRPDQPNPPDQSVPHA